MQMRLSVDDLESLIRLLDEHPEWREALQERLMTEQVLLRLLQQRADLREAVRRLVLTDELLELPALVRELIEVQRRTEERLAELAAQTDARFAELAAELAELARRTDARFAELATELAELARRTDARFAELATELAELARRTDARFAELAEAQRRTEERLAELAAQTDARFAELAEAQRRTQEQVALLVETQRRIEEELAQLRQDVHDLREWRRGEEGRRAGERFEIQIIKRAPRLLNGGDGGRTEEPHVRQRLTHWLRNLQPAEMEDDFDGEKDPTLADLIWWKDSRVAVIEISLKVDGRDVLRARQRADTLRQAGVDAIPLVIGEEWATPDSRLLAEQNGVEWMLKGDLSAGMIEFRRLP